MPESKSQILFKFYPQSDPKPRQKSFINPQLDKNKTQKYFMTPNPIRNPKLQKTDTQFNAIIEI